MFPRLSLIARGYHSAMISILRALRNSGVVHDDPATRLILAMVNKECQEAFRYEDICFLWFFLVFLRHDLINGMLQASFALSPDVTYHRLVEYLLINMSLPGSRDFAFCFSGACACPERGAASHQANENAHVVHRLRSHSTNFYELHRILLHR